MCFAPQRRPLFRYRNLSQLPKVVRTCGVFSILTSTRALRRNRVHFLNSSTSKSDPTLLCFYHFHFHMCFKPQRCALVQHLNIQKFFGAAVFRHFDFEMCFAPAAYTFSTTKFPKVARECFLMVWLRNLLRVRPACTFSTSQRPKAFRGWGVLTMLTSEAASCHSGA